MLILLNIFQIATIRETVFFSKILKSIIIESFHLIIVIIIALFSVSLITHLLSGSFEDDFSDLFNAFYLNVYFVLCSFDGIYFDNNDTSTNIIILIVLILIKLLFINLIYGIIYKNYIEFREFLEEYNKRDHNKIVGDTIILKLIYYLFPLNFYFIYSDISKVKKEYEGLNKKKFIEEGEGNYNQNKLIVNKRIIHIIYANKKD